MGALVKLLVVVVLAVTAQQILRILITWGAFSHYYSHHPGPCTQVDDIQLGSEGFQTLSNGQTFITSGLRYLAMSPKCQEHWRRHKTKGRLYLMDLNNVQKGVQELKVTSTAHFKADTFVPHGISVWEDRKTGRHVVFVVNHPFEEGAADRVEKFIYDPNKQELVHQAHFSHPAMKVVNDVQATGENSFYFTNSNYFRTLVAVLLEVLLALPLTDVVHCDGQSCTAVDSGLKGPNGIAMSPDAHHVYVSVMVDQEIAVYRRHSDNSLTRVQTYPLYSWPDNIQVDERTGDLFVASHPVAYRFFAYTDDVGSLHSPSQVLQLRVNDGLIMSSQELLYDHGHLISASSTAVVHNGTLLVGSVWDKLVTCPVYVPLL